MRHKLDTTGFTTAKLRLGDFLKHKHRRAARPVLGTFSSARTLYLEAIAAGHTLKDGSKTHRHNCVKPCCAPGPASMR